MARIMLVDDEESILRLLQEIIEWIYSRYDFPE